MKKQKIGIDIRAIGQQRTGDEIYTLNLVRNILNIDLESQYFLLTDTINIEKIEKDIFKGSKKNKNFKIISVLPANKFFWTFFSLPRIVKKLKLDILHVQYITPLWLPKKTKLVTTIHDVSFKVFPDFIKKSDLFLLNLLIPFSLKRADKIIAISNFTKEEIIRYYKVKKEKIKVIYNGGMGERAFQESGKDNIKISNKIRIKKPYLFYIGTHQPRKDVVTLIEAFLRLKNNKKGDYRNLKLVIGGKIKAHNYDSRIDEVLIETKKDPIQKKHLDDLIFTGYLSEKEKQFLFKKAEIFVFPSLYEGFGVPLLEAMTLKTPVVCSDIECFKEIGGEAVKFFKAGDSNDLKNRLTEILKYDKIKKDLISKGEKRAKDFSWEKTAKDFLNFLKTI